MIERYDTPKLKKKKPDGMTDEHFDYLDELRESGRTNMFGAAAYLIGEMNVSRLDASKYVSYWIVTFSNRHKGE